MGPVPVLIVFLFFSPDHKGGASRRLRRPPGLWSPWFWTTSAPQAVLPLSSRDPDDPGPASVNRWGLRRLPAKPAHQAGPSEPNSQHQPQTAGPDSASVLQVCPTAGPPGPPCVHHPGDSGPVPASRTPPTQHLLFSCRLLADPRPDRHPLLSTRTPPAPPGARQEPDRRQPPRPDCQHQTGTTGPGPGLPGRR